MFVHLNFPAWGNRAGRGGAGRGSAPAPRERVREQPVSTGQTPASPAPAAGSSAVGCAAKPAQTSPAQPSTGRAPSRRAPPSSAWRQGAPRRASSCPGPRSSGSCSSRSAARVKFSREIVLRDQECLLSPHLQLLNSPPLLQCLHVLSTCPKTAEQEIALHLPCVVTLSPVPFQPDGLGRFQRLCEPLKVLSIKESVNASVVPKAMASLHLWMEGQTSLYTFLTLKENMFQWPAMKSPTRCARFHPRTRSYRL